jgi:hypothetical protein
VELSEHSFDRELQYRNMTGTSALFYGKDGASGTEVRAEIREHSAKK